MERYNYQQILKREKQKTVEDVTTVEDVAGLLRSVVNSRFKAIRDVAVNQVKRMTGNLKKRYRYEGIIKRKIAEALGEMSDLSIAQRQHGLKVVSANFCRGLHVP